MVLALLVSLAACAPALFALQLHSQRHERRHEIEQLEETWRNAMLKANVSVMDSLLADDYMGITANGTIETRDRVLASMRSGALRFSVIDLSERKLRSYGTTVLVTSRAEITGTNAGRDVSGGYRYTRVCAQDAQGKWKIVSFEVSRIREPGASK